MLIVCPSCATSYMIDPAALGATGRTVRCARCKVTWFAGGAKEEPKRHVDAFVDGVIAEAEAQSAPAKAEPPPPPPPAAESGADDDFGAEAPEPMPETMPEAMSEPEPHAEPADAEPPAEADAHVEDVEVADAPSLVPPIEQAPPSDDGNAALDSDDVESYAARRQRMQARRKQSRRSSRWTAIVLVLFAVNVALVGARDEVVRYLPQTASVFAAIGLPVNLRHLTFEKVRISKDVQNGVNVLIVEGTIVSTAKEPITVPRLRFAARDAAGQEIYTWTALPSRSILGPGEKLEFRSQLASPPADARNVMVRFFNSKDATGAK